MAGITEIDIIILSCAQSTSSKIITENCIDSLIISENPRNIKFNIVVLESNKELSPFEYSGTTTVYPDGDFGYNKFLNIGIEQTFSKYVCLCHNDLIFHPFWATEILEAFRQCADLSSASPICPLHHPRLGFQLYKGIYTGYRSNYEMAGWCIFAKRDIFRIMGKLDENYKFWCVDNDYAHMLSALRLRHALVSASIVDHLQNCIADQDSGTDQEKLTANEFFYFDKKWNYRTNGNVWKELI